jgi:DNA (cytosine-5)-methyltransferase 1
MAVGIGGVAWHQYWIERRPGKDPAVNDSKPPYQIPSMAEIAAVPKNGRRVVSTFSGCGGSCLGFEMAGYEIAYASEFVEAAADVYRRNHPDVPLDTRDIREVDPTSILLKAGIQAGDVDVLEGSPPCASFSMAGKREADWGKTKAYSDTKQRTDDLFWEFARIVEGIKPKVFVAENVAGLTVGKARGYFKEIHSTLEGCGYRVAAKVLDAQWLGVPQRRRRLIFVGVRNDLDRDPVFPKPFPYRYSLGEVLPDPGVFDPSSPESFVGTAIEPAWERLRPGEGSSKYLNLIRSDRDAPSPTVTQAAGGRGTAGVTHPDQKRKFTIEELKIVCGFPADFELTGRYTQQWERLGRAVPPPMMRAVASELLEVI